MIAIACPGQGSQSPGFLAPWLELEIFRETIAELSDQMKLDLAKLGTVASAEEIRDTAIAQPLIVAAGIACFESIKSLLPTTSLGVAGHSVGEVTAAYVAGIMNMQQAAKFVKIRGEQMAIAAGKSETSMAAVVGGDLQLVQEAIEKLGLVIANFNGPGQVVAAGPKTLILELVANPPAGTRVVQLEVAGAFHTQFMAAAKLELEALAATMSVQDPKLLIWTNKDGSAISNGSDFVALLVDQVANPVRWDKTMDTMLTASVKALIELTPAGTLSGIAKRAMKEVESLAIKSPSDLDKLPELIGRHSQR